MTGSAAAKVTQTYHQGARLSNVIYRQKDLFCNLAALNVDAGDAYNRLLTTLGQNKMIQMHGNKTDFMQAYLKENFVRAIKCSHDFHFIKYMKPAVSTTNAYVKNKPLDCGSIVRGRTSKLDIISRFDPSAAFLTDMGLHIRVKAPPPTTVLRPDADGNLVQTNVRWRWCDFPGIRLLERSEIQFTQSDVEKYTYWDIMNETASMMDENLRQAWYRCVGQDTGMVGKLFNVGLSADQSMRFFKGYQTLKVQQDDLDLFIPLRFFCNKKIGDALQVTNLDEEQLELHFVLADLAHMIEGQVDPVPAIAARTSAPEIYTELQSLNVTNVELWTNNIFTPPCIQDLLLNREIYNVVTIRQQFQHEVNSREGRFEFDKVRFLLEDIIVQVARKSQTSGMETWWRDGIADESDVCGVAVLPGNPPQLVTRPYVGYSHTNLLQSLKLTTKGEDIIEFVNPKFMQEYTHFVRGQQKSGTVVLMPETYRLLYSWAQQVNDNTSIHASANLSREREVYLEYNGLDDNISKSNPAQFFITAHVKAVVIHSQGTAALFFN